MTLRMIWNAKVANAFANLGLVLSVVVYLCVLQRTQILCGRHCIASAKQSLLYRDGESLRLETFKEVEND